MKTLYLHVDGSTNIILSVFSVRLDPYLIEVEVEDTLQIHVGEDKFINGEIVCLHNEERAHHLEELNTELIQLRHKLSETDYLAIKFAEGEMTEEEFAPHREERRNWRARINEIEKEL